MFAVPQSCTVPPLDVLKCDSWKECEDLLSQYYDIIDGYIVQQRILDEKQAEMNRQVGNRGRECSVINFPFVRQRLIFLVTPH